MYCTKCGAKQPEEAAYCAACGTRLIKQEPQPSAPPAPTQARAASESTPEQTTQSIPDPAAQPAASEPTPQPTSRSTPEPAAQSAAPPAPDTALNPSAPASQAVSAPAPNPAAGELPSVLLTRSDPPGSGSGYRYPEPKPTFAARYGSLLALLSLIVLVAGGWYGWNQYRAGIDRQAAQLEALAGELAQGGDYSAALDRLAEAAELRPEDASIAADAESLHAALRAQGELEQVAARLDGRELEAAEQSLDGLEAELGTRPGELLKRERDAAAAQRGRLELLRAEQQLEASGDAEALIALLGGVGEADTAEARDMRERIVDKIVSVSSAQAESMLREHNYSSAATIVETALGYASANTALLELNGRIETEERAEEERREADKAEAEEQRRAEEEARVAAEAAAQAAAENRAIEQAAAQDQAEYTVQAFYDELSGWNYGGAYALLGSRWQKGTGYADFANGYTNTLSVVINSIDSAPVDGNTEVTIFITAEEITDSGTVYSTYRSVYQVGYENGIMKILSGKGEKLS
ncbi:MULTISPECIES: zinc ribbon domain-containing protein [Saccharibacillus]|uniref:zinc ribbon domain-containing protein n=1 Tax=Saccharibacillus TaxID=456492 RepID=UPI0012388917|nr:zinc ribbon domain-containing protein [Saccharibacillus sp. WB 17]MWJ32636.1 zinc-ribbon domain-containing protein [Saccharibacillus sp. WB 17]